MSKLKIIITMAGEGSRFKKVGYSCPKHEIEVNGKSLLEWSLESLLSFKAEEFILIARRENYNQKHIAKVTSKLGIERCTVLEIDELTCGQAETALLADCLMAADDQILIYNIDTYIEPSQLSYQDFHNCNGGHIYTFHADGDKWSFTDVSDGSVSKVTEKIRISNNASVGLYYFKSWDLFKKTTNYRKEKIINEYNELYIAPLYQALIDNEFSVTASLLDSNKVHVLGTPEDVEMFKLRENERHRS